MTVVHAWRAVRFTRDKIAAFPEGMRRSLVVIVGLDVGFGLMFLLTSPHRFTGPGFTYALRAFGGLRWAGALFLGCAALMAFAAATGYLLVTALRATAMFFEFWAVLFFIAWCTIPHASFSGVLSYGGLGLWAALCISTVRQWRRASEPG